MTLTLELPDILQASLQREAARRHVEPEALVLETLEREFARKLEIRGTGQPNTGLLEVLRRMNMELEDPDKEESLEEVFDHMNEEREAQDMRPLFLPEVKGKAW